MIFQSLVSKLKILFNPASKGGRSTKKVKKIKEELEKRSLDYEIEETLGPRKAIEQAIKAGEEGFDTVIAMGGDGTVNEVANGCIRAGLTFGVIPLGSGNDFACGIGIDTWEKGIDTIAQNHVKPISILKIGDHYSVNVLDAGLGADVVKLSENHLKWISGSKKYTLLTLRETMRHKKYPVTITIDGKSEDYDLNILAMGFGQTFGSGMNILPDARYDHDEMQIAVIHSASKLKILQLFPTIFPGKHVKYTKYVTMLTGKKVTIQPKANSRDLNIEAEGEIFSLAPVEIEVIPKGLNVIMSNGWKLKNHSSKVEP